MLLHVIFLHLRKHFHSWDILITSSPHTNHLLLAHSICPSTTYIITQCMQAHPSSNNHAGTCNPMQQPYRHTQVHEIATQVHAKLPRRYTQPPCRHMQPPRRYAQLPCRHTQPACRYTQPPRRRMQDIE